MRLFIAITLCFATSLYGWTGTLTAHIEEQCHVVEGEHHDEALVDHIDEHQHDSEHTNHEEDDDCQPEHCSDHCGICHVSATGFVIMAPQNACHGSPFLKEVSSRELVKLASIATRPDTPPPKA